MTNINPRFAAYDFIDWDDAFDNSGYVTGASDLAQKWSRLAAEFRAHRSNCVEAELDLAYGTSPRNRLDIFHPAGELRGLIVFVHGGYWHLLDKSYWSHLARGPLSSGWALAIPSYSLAPEVEISTITREIGSAVEFAANRIDGPIRLIGHSAGGHLVSRMVCDDSPLAPTALARLQKVVPVSGVFDLRPLTRTRMNQTLHLSDDEAIAESPFLHSPRGEVDICFWVGAAERPEFLRQTRSACESWQRHSNRVTDFYQPGQHHFSVIEGLGDPVSALLNCLTT